MSASPRVISVALAATLLFAACGSDDDAASTASTAAVTETTSGTPSETTTEATTEPTTETTTVEAQDVAADTEAAQAAVLTVADLPDGWTDAAAADSADIDGLVAECVGVDSLTSPDATASPAAFTSPDGTLVVTQAVGVQATEGDARGVVAQLTTPSVPECVAAAYTTLGVAALNGTTTADGAEIGEITATRLAVGSAGDATQAIRVTVPVTAEGATAPVNVDIVVVRSGRSLSTLTFEAGGEPAAVETIDEITAAAASRLPA